MKQAIVLLLIGLLGFGYVPDGYTHGGRVAADG